MTALRNQARGGYLASSSELFDQFFGGMFDLIEKQNGIIRDQRRQIEELERLQRLQKKAPKKKH